MNFYFCSTNCCLFLKVSFPDFHLYPSHSTEIVDVVIEWYILLHSELMQLTSNQLLVLSNFKYFASYSTINLAEIMKYFYARQSSLVVVEVNLKNIDFIQVDDYFDSGDLLSWIKVVTFLKLAGPALHV